MMMSKRALTGAERQSASKKRLLQSGGRRVTVVLRPEDAERLDRMPPAGVSDAEKIRRLIRASRAPEPL